jgi:hypothetical protein
MPLAFAIRVHFEADPSVFAAIPPRVSPRRTVYVRAFPLLPDPFRSFDRFAGDDRVTTSPILVLDQDRVAVTRVGCPSEPRSTQSDRSRPFAVHGIVDGICAQPST